MTALATFEALLMEHDFVDRTDFLHLVNAFAASSAKVGFCRSEQVAETFRGVAIDGTVKRTVRGVILRHGVEFVNHRLC